MNDRETRILTKDEYDKWDDLVDSSPQSTVFHRRAWITTCAKLSNKKNLIFGKFKNDDLIGGCQLFIDKNLALRSAYSNIGLTPYGGFILQYSESTQVREREKNTFSICSSISQAMGELKFDHIKIINPPTFQDVRPFIRNGWSPDLYYTYILPLTGNIEKEISKDVRWTIRKALKEGITVRKIYDPDLYWNLNVDTYGKQGKTPPFSRQYLKGIMEMIIKNNLGEMWIAETTTSEPASAEFIIWDKHMVHRWSAASSSRFKKTGATSLLLFEIFRDLQQRGFEKINLMAGNKPNLTTFISSFNPSLVPYFGITRSSKKYQLCNEMLKFKKLVYRIKNAFKVE